MTSKQPNQLMCIECGDTRPYFTIPETKKGDGLLSVFKFALVSHAASGLNSTIPETREYWRNKLGITNETPLGSS